MRSLRSRLMLGTAAATALLLAVSGVAIYLAVRASLRNEFDGALVAKARALAAMTEQKGSQLKLESEPEQMPEFHRRQHAEYFQLWNAQGKVAVRSPSLGAGDLPYFRPTLAAAQYRALVLPDGRAGRAIAIAFQPHPEDEEERQPAKGQPPILVVARDTVELDHTLAVMRWLLALVCSVATLASAAAMVGIIRRGLRPLDALAARIATMDHSSLSHRLALNGTPSELAPITRRLNELLARLEGAFVREKSFSADVAHELRTPLAGLQTALEVCTSRQRAPEEYEQVAAKCLQTTRRIHTMLDNLLMLARMEGHQAQLSSQTVTVEGLVQECWRWFAERASGRQLQVQFAVEPSCSLSTDREKLRLILQNLFDNAVSYCNQGGSIRVEASHRDGGLIFNVINTGSSLSPQQAEHVFERFWRGDAARSDTGVHCGLGLTLCKRMVEMLGGTITVHSETGGDFGIAMVLPAGS